MKTAIERIKFNWLSISSLFSLSIITYFVEPKLTLLPISLGLYFSFLGYKWLNSIGAIINVR